MVNWIWSIWLCVCVCAYSQMINESFITVGVQSAFCIPAQTARQDLNSTHCPVYLATCWHAHTHTHDDLRFIRHRCGLNQTISRSEKTASSMWMCANVRMHWIVLMKIRENRYDSFCLLTWQVNTSINYLQQSKSSVFIHQSLQNWCLSMAPGQSENWIHCLKFHRTNSNFHIANSKCSA